MRVNRRFLGWGVFLVAVGGVLVVADLGAVDTAVIADDLRLWPLAVIAIGLGLALRRTRISLPASMLAAAVPGLLIGGAVAVAPHYAVDCGDSAVPTTVATRQGSFDGPARVLVITGCGGLVVNTAPGSDWGLQLDSMGDREPSVTATSRSLTVEAGTRQGWHLFYARKDTWNLTLPTSPIDELSLTVNAGDGRIDLAGAQLARFDVTVNAAQAHVDLSTAHVSSLSGTVNAGLLSVQLPSASDVAGTLDVNAGDLQLCVPAGLGLRVHHSGVLSGITVRGQGQTGTDWQSEGYASAAHHADLTITVDLGGVEIDPIGGCK